MNMKKILSLLMAVAMVLSLVVVPAYATEERALKLADKDGNTTITAEAGSKVEVYLSTVGTWGFNAIGGYVTYPDGWTVKSSNQVNKLLVLEEIEAEATFTNYDGANPVSLLWTTMGVEEDDGTKLLEIGGTLAKLTFTIPAEATPGTYDITIDTVNGNPNVAFAHDANGVITSFDVADATILDVAAINCQIVIPAPEAPPAVCPEHPEATWNEIAAGTWTGGALPTGHYKLTGDQTVTAELTVAAGEAVCIDLNGCTIKTAAQPSKSSAYRVFNNAGTLTITDLSAEKAGKITLGKQYGGEGTVLEGGNIYNTGTLNLYEGTISGGYLQASSYKVQTRGGNVYNSGTFNMYGGKVTAGKIARTYVPDSEDYELMGMNIYSNGTLNIQGGVIDEAKYTHSYTSDSGSNTRCFFAHGANICAEGGTLTIANATVANSGIQSTCTRNTGVTGPKILGGNIYAANATVVLTNATITGGYAKGSAVSTNTTKAASVYTYGGNLYVVGGTLTATGTTISGGVVTAAKTSGYEKSEALSNGSNVYLTGTTATITDCVIDGGSCGYRGGNLYMTGCGASTITNTELTNGQSTSSSGRGGNAYIYNTELTLDNCTVSGGVAKGRGGNLAFSGSKEVTINGGTITASDTKSEYGANIYCTDGDANCNVILQGGVVVSGGSAELGGNIAAMYGMLTVKDATIKDGVASDAGGNIYAVGTSKASVITIENGAKIENGRIYISDTDAPDTLVNTLTIETGAVVDTMSAASKGTSITIEDGVTLNSDPTKYQSGEAALESDGKYVTYGKMADALAAAEAADTVILAKDVAVEGDVDIYCALELNGKNLTATGVIDASNKDASIIDSVGTSTATGSEFYAHAKNGMLAVDAANDNNVTFETVSARQKFEQNGEAVRIKFVIDDAADDTKLDEAILAGSNVKVRITVYSAALNDGFHTFAYQQSMVETYAAAWGTKMFYCDISGLEDLGEYTVVAEIVSEGIVLEAVTVA